MTKVDPRQLRVAEAVRLLNSTPLGEVAQPHVVYRHLNRAGLHIGDGKRIDLLRYAAWLFHARQERPPAGWTENDYEAHKDAVNARSRESSESSRDIGAAGWVHEPKNIERKEKCRASFRSFCESYFAQTFHLAWSDDHLKVISKIEKAVLEGGLFAMAMPRGSGKTTLCEVACIWSLVYGHRDFVALIGADEEHAEDMLESIAALEPVWLGFKKWFLEVVYGAFYGALSAWEIVQHGLSVAWIETTSFLSKTWTNFISFLRSSWESVQNWLEDRWHELFALFDETYDAGAAKAMADRLSQQSQQKLEQERQAALDAQEQNRSAQRHQESQQSDAALAKIGGDYQQAIAEVSAANAAKIKSAQDAVDQARAEWQKAIDEARGKRTAADAKRESQPTDNPTDVNDQFTGLADVLAEAQKRTIGVAGTFNAAEARGLGAGGVADRIAKAAEQTAINTKKLLEEMQDMEPSEFE